MNCKELRAYLEKGSIFDVLAARESEISEHLSDCRRCREFFEIRSETAASLRLLRETTPPIPASFNAKVLANYRRQVAASEAEPTRRHFRFTAWRLASAFVAVVLIGGLAAMAYWATKKPSILPIPQTGVAHQSIAPNSPPPAIHRQPAVARMLNTQKHETTSDRLISATVPTPIADGLETSPAEGFRSLMYCDDLSCGGGMQMVRVELPARAAGLTQVSASPSGFVTADVLIGPDGFARGIRIVH